MASIMISGKSTSLHSTTFRMQEGINQNLFHLAAILLRPVCKTHEIGCRIFSPIHPNQYDHYSTRQKELAFRILVCPLFIFSLSALSLFFAPLSMIVRLPANMTKKYDFNYLKGKLPELNTIPEKFTHLTWNVCMISAGFPYDKGGVPPWRNPVVPLLRPRIDAIIDLVKKNSADVITLQEVHDQQAAMALCKGLENEYAHFYFNIGSHNMGANSGLFVASKYPINNPEFVTFDQKTLPGLIKFVKKGFFSFDLQAQGKTFSRLVNTHLSHSEEDLKPRPFEITNRKQQMAEITKWLNDKSDISPTILCGDLNMRPEEYMAFKKDFENGYLQSNNSKKEEEFGTNSRDALVDILYKNPAIQIRDGKIEYADARSLSVLLDHTLLLKKQDWQKTTLETKLVKVHGFNTSSKSQNDLLDTPGAALSDHHALLSTITLKTLIFLK